MHKNILLKLASGPIYPPGTTEEQKKKINDYYAKSYLLLNKKDIAKPERLPDIREKKPEVELITKIKENTNKLLSGVKNKINNMSDNDKKKAAITSAGVGAIGIGSLAAAKHKAKKKAKAAELAKLTKKKKLLKGGIAGAALAGGSALAAYALNKKKKKEEAKNNV